MVKGVFAGVEEERKRRREKREERSLRVCLSHNSGAPKYFFGSPSFWIFCGERVENGSRWVKMGQNWGAPKIIFSALWGLPRAPKIIFGSLCFSNFDLACACLIENFLFNSK